MKLYKNGTLADMETEKAEPSNLTRSVHYLGWTGTNSNFFDGTIAYLRFWHGVALDAEQVLQLFADRTDPTLTPTSMPSVPTALPTLLPSNTPSTREVIVMDIDECTYDGPNESFYHNCAPSKSCVNTLGSYSCEEL